MREYVLTENVLKRLKKIYNPFICRLCRRPFKAGDKIVSCGSNKRGKKAFYHKECFEETQH